MPRTARRDAELRRDYLANRRDPAALVAMLYRLAGSPVPLWDLERLAGPLPEEERALIAHITARSLSAPTPGNVTRRLLLADPPTPTPTGGTPMHAKTMPRPRCERQPRARTCDCCGGELFTHDGELGCADCPLPFTLAEPPNRPDPEPVVVSAREAA